MQLEQLDEPVATLDEQSTSPQKACPANTAAILQLQWSPAVERA